jgi:hypothetical protein
MIITREEIIATLTSTLIQESFIRAAWLGGSDASGRTDQWSDIDLQMVVEDTMVEKAFDIFHHHLTMLSPIQYVFRLSSPTWHGHEQEFVSLRYADPCHLIDLVIMKLSSENWFLEKERHGEPLILFDKDDLVHPPQFDTQAHNIRMQKRLERLRTVFPLFQNFVSKAVKRNDHVDAVQSLLTYTIRPFIELARMRYSPSVFDYGLRYLDRDIPQDLHDEMKRLILPRTVDEIEYNRKRIEELFTKLMNSYDRGEWTLDDQF